jgi:hypothetical protein
MGALSESEARFDEAKGSPRSAKAWKALKEEQPSLGGFSEPEDLRDFCQDPSIPYREQDPVVLVLCTVAMEETQARAKSRFATDLLTWIFLPALWKVAEQAATAETLSPREIEAEVLSGFWEQAVSEHQTCEGLSGRLVNSARHQVWRVIRSRLKEDHSTIERLATEEAPDLADPIWSDPWMLLSWARLHGKVKDSDAELIFWTRLQGEPLARICALLGLNYEAGRARRYRAERAIADWLGQLGKDYPPKDPELARECLAIAQKPSEVAQVLGRSLVPNRARDVLGK